MLNKQFSPCIGLSISLQLVVVAAFNGLFNAIFIINIRGIILKKGRIYL